MALSVVVITKNEERNIGRCLQSVTWADEWIVVDSDSTDRTVEIAREFGARIVSHEWRGFGPAKQAGVDQAGEEWVLSIDADEEVTPELAEEIRKVTADSGPHAGYYMNRRTNFLGRWIGHCGWYPDAVLRLFRREAGRFNDAVIHESIQVDGTTGRLRADLRHYCYPTLELYLRKSNLYTTLGAEEAFRRGKRAGWFDVTIRPISSFLSHYIFRQGFRDGLEGFLVSVLSAQAVMAKYAKLRHMWRRQRQEAATDA